MNKFYTIVILGLILCLLLREGCNCARINKLEKDCGKTVVRVDTAWIKEAVNIPVYVPTPGQTIYHEVPKYYTKVINGDTVRTEIHDTVLAKDFFASVPYADSVSVKYGKVYINDTISQNRITSRAIRTDFNIPVVTKTVIKQPRGYLSAGVGVQGDMKDYINAAGVSIMWTSKRRFSVEAGTMYGLSNRITYGLGLKFPLSLK